MLNPQLAVEARPYVQNVFLTTQANIRELVPNIFSEAAVNWVTL